MEIICEKCGHPNAIKGIGRKPLNITVQNVLDALRECPDIRTAVVKLQCGKGSIYRILKRNGLVMKDVLQDIARERAKHIKEVAGK